MVYLFIMSKYFWIVNLREESGEKVLRILGYSSDINVVKV